MCRYHFFLPHIKSHTPNEKIGSADFILLTDQNVKKMSLELNSVVWNAVRAYQPVARQITCVADEVIIYLHYCLTWAYKFNCVGTNAQVIPTPSGIKVIALYDRLKFTIYF